MWALVKTEVSGGHVFEVSLYESQQKAIDAADLKHLYPNNKEYIAQQLWERGEWADRDTRISVLETSK